MSSTKHTTGLVWLEKNTGFVKEVAVSVSSFGGMNG